MPRLLLPLNVSVNVMAKQASPFLHTHRWRLLGWGFAGCLLLAPLVAMRYTEEVRWTGFDFAVAAALIISVGLGVEWAVRHSHNFAYRGGVALALMAAFLLLWINGAVGIMGSEKNPANLLYLGIIAVAAMGAVIAGFKPRGMAKAMLAAALAQLVVEAAAISLGHFTAFLTAFFCFLWLCSARLFQISAGPSAATAMPHASE